MTTPVIIVHGGAWSLPDNLVDGSRQGTKAAARAGYQILERGGSAMDAIEAAVIVLENDPSFDAGTGSVLNSNGEVEMDAVVMDGKTLKTGAVACVQNLKNPVLLARLVMEKTDHCMLVGRGANQFAEEVGMATVPKESLVSEEAIRELECFHQYGSTVESLFRERGSGHDTVGAVAIDSQGNLAYGTSTGGISCKKPGRVGDSPIVGLGGYADNDSGSVSCTGHGESISKMVLAYNICSLMKQGTNPQEAADTSLANMAKRVHGYGGVIVINNKGEVAKSFTTERMSWAYIRDNTLHHGVNPGEDMVEAVSSNNNENKQNGGTN